MDFSIEKKHIYILTMVGALLLGAVLVHGFGSSDPTFHGHDSSELIVDGSSITSGSIGTAPLAANAVTDDKLSDDVSLSNGLLFAPSGGTGVGIGTTTVGSNALQVVGHIETSGSLIVEPTSSLSDPTFLMRPSSGQANGWQVHVEASGSNHELFFVKGDSTSPIILAMDADGLAIDGCLDPDHDLILGGFGAGCNSGTYSEIDKGEASFTTSSSRSIKENFEPVNSAGILEAINNVPVYTYDFIDGPKDKMGLVAEDFHTVFGRGSDKQINGQEVTMALWLAVQELSLQNKQLKQIICLDHPEQEFC